MEIKRTGNTIIETKKNRNMKLKLGDWVVPRKHPFQICQTNLKTPFPSSYIQLKTKKSCVTSENV